MANCVQCTEFDDCPFRSDPDTLCSAFKRKPMTNGDRIRNMTDEELAELIGDNINCFVCEKVVFEVSKCPGSMTVGRYCHDVWLNWLKEQTEEGE